MSAIIRLARPEDIPALIDLASETFIDSFGNYHTPENCQAFIAQSHNENIYRAAITNDDQYVLVCLLYTSPSPRDATLSRMPSSA